MLAASVLLRVDQFPEDGAMVDGSRGETRLCGIDAVALAHADLIPISCFYVTDCMSVLSRTGLQSAALSVSRCRSLTVGHSCVGCSRLAVGWQLPDGWGNRLCDKRGSRVRIPAERLPGRLLALGAVHFVDGYDPLAPSGGNAS